ncbi:MAG: hypothetical protein M0Z69_15035 [Actinomycetota bacterium]|jgi:hypothetical protein|nr:hypothetical protein [Actinomycetota bacterium]
MSPRRFKPDRDVTEWTGPVARYDLAKEVTISFVVVLLLVIAFAAIFSSPDDHPVTLKSWATAMPVDFVQTAVTELDGTSPTATYGPPYNETPGAGQKIGPVSLARLAGVHIPINTTEDFVIKPLLTLPNAPALDSQVSRYESAGVAQRTSWDAAYEKAIAAASFPGYLKVPSGRYGPVGVMMTNLLAMARSGALDGALLSSPQLYGTDYTKPLLFIADGSYMSDLAANLHLQGDQWGMMNETGNFPGQAWLWLYTMWYQVPPFNTSSSGDALVWAVMMLLTLVLILVPFIPGLRSIPRWVRIYRLIWRRHYRSVTTEAT